MNFSLVNLLGTLVPSSRKAVHGLLMLKLSIAVVAIMPAAAAPHTLERPPKATRAAGLQDLVGRRKGQGHEACTRVVRATSRGARCHRIRKSTFIDSQPGPNAAPALQVPTVRQSLRGTQFNKWAEVPADSADLKVSCGVDWRWSQLGLISQITPVRVRPPQPSSTRRSGRRLCGSKPSTVTNEQSPEPAGRAVGEASAARRYLPATADNIGTAAVRDRDLGAGANTNRGASACVQSGRDLMGHSQTQARPGAQSMRSI